MAAGGGLPLEPLSGEAVREQPRDRDADVEQAAGVGLFRKLGVG